LEKSTFLAQKNECMCAPSFFFIFIPQIWNGWDFLVQEIV